MEPNTKTALVHKHDSEGALVIDAHTGIITQPIDERPEWSEGLAVALLAERHSFYNSRLGPNYSDEMKMPEAYNFEDLGWLGVDAEGDELETLADDEFRMNKIAEIIGMDRTVEGSHHSGKVLAEVEIAMDQERTHDEVSALEYAQDHGFAEKTGTKG